MREIDTFGSSGRTGSRRAIAEAESPSRASLSIHNLDRLLQHRHHAEAEQIDFQIPRSAQSSLSHCTTTRPGIEAFSSGTTSSSRPWQIDHAAGVLAEMARQILHLAPERRESWSTRDRRGSRPASRRLPRERLARIDELELVHHLGQPIDLRLARSRAPCPLRARRCGRDT